MKAIAPAVEARIERDEAFKQTVYRVFINRALLGAGEFVRSVRFGFRRGSTFFLFLVVVLLGTATRTVPVHTGPKRVLAPLVDGDAQQLKICNAVQKNDSWTWSIVTEKGWIGGLSPPLTTKF